MINFDFSLFDHDGDDDDTQVEIEYGKVFTNDQV